MKKQKTEKKAWRLKAINGGGDISFRPTFSIMENDEETATTKNLAETSKDVRCEQIEMVMTNAEGKEHTMVFNYLDIFMFIYFCANEELRMQLQTVQERDIYNIPYDVTFKLDAAEKQEGMARRRIELPIDEVTMAYIRNEAMKKSGMIPQPNLPTVMGPRGPTFTSKLPKKKR